MAHPHFYPRQQHGAALVIGLILLLILTVLGVSGLGTATTEVRLADNNKQREYVFQSAESALRESVKRGGLITINGLEAENGDVRDPIDYNYDHLDAEGAVTEANVDVTVDTVYRGRSAAPAGYDSAPVYGIGTFESVHFLVHAEANASRGATGTVRQGFYIPAPAP